MISEYRTFLSTALRNPRMVGAATPTSKAVGQAVAQLVPTTGSPIVVEVGPGTGALSGAIRQRLPHSGRHIGIELGEGMVNHLRQHAPWMEVIHGDAREAVTLLDDIGVKQADVLVTSIPWSLLPAETQQDTLRQVVEVLHPQGAFSALTYVPAHRKAGGKRFRTLLDLTFDEVITHTTWRSMPPVLHYLCRRPLQPGS